MFCASSPVAAELVIADNKTCDYQIVLPEPGGDPIVDHWLTLAGRLVQAAFAKSGFELPITTEASRAEGKPGLYLGATRFAGTHGIDVAPLDDWTYHFKAAGRDVVIAGHDRSDPATRENGEVVPLALLGTMKGVCDFLREYAGVRFLFMSGDSDIYPAKGKRRRGAPEQGPLNLDTRSIAFLPVERIALPGSFDRKKKPLMLASYDSSQETLFHIANNFFPELGSLRGATVTWYGVLATAKYAKTNPEFFALTKDGRRACEQKVGFDEYMSYCAFNKTAHDLIFEDVEKKIAAGAKIIHLSAMDAYRLCQCNCDDCNRVFGMRAGSFDEVRERGRTGRLWQAFFAITERAREKHPGVRFTLLNYQDTPVSADVIRRFPENVIVRIQFASQRDFDRLVGVEFPAGICGFEETFTGFGQAGPYVAERTPEHMVEVVKAIARNGVKWSRRDGAMGYVRGLQAPAYYVYGRMMDDPDADPAAIEQEFYEAAFAEVAKPMTEFFNILHRQMAIYSDFFGVFMPAWDRKYSRSKYHDSKWHVMSIYTPEFCADADALLTAAEKGTKDPNVLARLHLVRIEFDYIRRLSRIFYLQNAWTMNSSQANLDPLVDAIDEWHGDLEKLAGGTGRSTMLPLGDWPEMRPFNGHFYLHAALENEGYQQQWNKTCVNWDTKAIRAGILNDTHQLKVAGVDAEPAIDSEAWEAAPEVFFRLHDGMPFANTCTRMKVLRDRENLYVRVQCLNPGKHPEDFYPMAPDSDVFSQECVELGIAPPNAEGRVYRLAANPVEGSRYDSVNVWGERGLVEDSSWDAAWQFRFAVTGQKGPYTLPGRVWTAWFKIPFFAFRASPPRPAEKWGFNAGRHRAPVALLWKDSPSAKVVRELGTLEF